MIRVHGFDLALNHGACVEFFEGRPSKWWFYTDRAGCATRGGDVATRLIFSKSLKDRQQLQMSRLSQIERWITKILIERKPDLIGIEDYAIRQEQGAHYMGEVGGIARMIAWSMGIPFRLHDPLSVKMFAALDGTAQKDAVERSMAEEYPDLPFEEYNMPKPSSAKKQNRQTSEDLYDATAIALLIWTEHLLREGEITTSDLGHKKRIQVFNRVTKTYPTNLLDRNWIVNDPRPSGSIESRLVERIKDSRSPKLTSFLLSILNGG